MGPTYKDIINEFKGFCDRHPNISQSIDAQTWDFQAAENIYPAVVIVPSTSSGTGSSILLGFSIFFCDVLIADGSNTRNVYSDMLEIAKDFIAYFTGSPDLEWTIESGYTLIPFEEKFDDIVGGWQLDCTVEIPFRHNVCDIPLKDEE